MASDVDDHGAPDPGVPTLAPDFRVDGTVGPGTSGHVPADPHVVVLFGATGDLAKRKLLPGLFHL